jgi:hypothetical protein
MLGRCGRLREIRGRRFGDGKLRDGKAKAQRRSLKLAWVGLLLSHRSIPESAAPLMSHSYPLATIIRLIDKPKQRASVRIMANHCATYQSVGL